MVMIGFLGGLWWMTRRAIKAKQDPDLVLNFGFIALVFMAVGARAFYVIHYWDTQFKYNPSQIFNFRSGGFEFYGGFIGALVPCLLYAMYKRLSLRLWLDLVTPTLLFAMGVGRIGCFLAGCCYGTPCPPALPWAMQFPYGSEPQFAHWEQRLAGVPAELLYVSPEGWVSMVTPKSVQELADLRKQVEAQYEKVKAEGDSAKLARFDMAMQRLNAIDEHMAAYHLTQADLAAMADDPALRSPYLHPTQLYSAIGPLLLAWLTNAYFFRRKRHGTVFVLGMMLYAVERFIEESIRLDNPQDTFGLTVSQAISIGVLVILGLWLIVLQRLPLRSSRATAYVPKDSKRNAGSSPVVASS